MLRNLLPSRLPGQVGIPSNSPFWNSFDQPAKEKDSAKEIFRIKFNNFRNIDNSRIRTINFVLDEDGLRT